jgi:triacylglycerol lipase
MLRKLLPALLLAAATSLPAAPAAAVTATPSGTGADVHVRNPVVLVTGLIGLAPAYEPLAGRLRADGLRVFVWAMPNLGMGDIADSAQALARYVDRLRAEAGVTRLDLVGHSEGGLTARHYLKFLGGTAYVDRYVSLGSPHYGTYVANLATFVTVGSCLGIVACRQMVIGSDFLADLNAGDDTPGAVEYTAIRTLQDELVRPTWHASLDGGATNILIQAGCPFRWVGHLGLVTDGTAYSLVRGALGGGPLRADCAAA